MDENKRKALDAALSQIDNNLVKALLCEWMIAR